MIRNGKTEIQNSAKLKRKKIWAQIVRDRQLYILLLPFVLYYIIFYYMPMYGLQIAFKDYKPLIGIWESEWVGLKHFVNFFTGPYAWRTIRNTLMISTMNLCINFTLTIVFAILLNEISQKKLRSAVQTIAYMPHFISTVVVAGLVVALLSPGSGVINMLLERLGFEKIYFLAKPEYFRWIYTFMTGWQSIGFETIMYTSAICSIDEALYEAARVDGAGRLRRIFNITIPGISGTIAVMLIMRIGQLMSLGSDAILLLYQPITYETADVISTFVYRSGIEESNYSFASAVGLFNSVISLILVVCSNAISRKISDNSIW